MQSDITSHGVFPALRASFTAAVRLAMQPLMSPNHCAICPDTWGSHPSLDCRLLASAFLPRSMKARALALFAFIMESVAGRASEQDRCLLEPVGAGPRHD